MFNAVASGSISLLLSLLLLLLVVVVVFVVVVIVVVFCGGCCCCCCCSCGGGCVCNFCVVVIAVDVMLHVQGIHGPVQEAAQDACSKQSVTKSRD